MKKNINENYPGKEYVDEIYTMENLPDKCIYEAIIFMQHYLKQMKRLIFLIKIFLKK